jgi:hypothetical protein
VYLSHYFDEDEAIRWLPATVQEVVNWGSKLKKKRFRYKCELDRTGTVHGDGLVTVEPVNIIVRDPVRLRFQTGDKVMCQMGKWVHAEVTGQWPSEAPDDYEGRVSAYDFKVCKVLLFQTSVCAQEMHFLVYI